MRKQRSDTGFRPVSRIGIFLAILLVTATALAATYLLLRESLLQHVHDQANEVVEQEIEQLIEFSETATDPSTANAFGSSTRLLDVYLSTRIPGPDESVVGIVDNRLIQMNRGDSTRRLEPDSPLLAEISTSPDAAGVIHPGGPDSPAVHWGKVHLGSPTDPRPAAFVVLHHTDNDVAEMNHTLELLRTAGTMVFALAAVPALILSLLLGWRRRWRPRAEPSPTPPEAPTTPEPAPVGDVAQTYRATLVHTNRQMQAPLRHLGRATRNQPVLATAVQQLRQASDSLAGLSRMMQPGAAGEDLRLDSGELTWQLVQRIRQDTDREIRLTSTATGQQVSVNPEQLRLALGEVVRGLPHSSRTGEVEFGTAFRGGKGDRILSLWLRHHDGEHPGEKREPDHPPLLQAVAEYHGGRAWSESAPQLGLMFGMDIPVGSGSR